MIDFNQVVSDLSKTHSVSWGDRLLTLDKTCGFLTPGLRTILTTMNKVTDSYAGPDSVAWRVNTLVWASKLTAGDIVECGVFKGDMMWALAALGEKRPMHLFDTFEGFPESQRGGLPDKEGLYAFLQQRFSPPGLYESVIARFSPFPNVRVIKGVVPDSLDLTDPIGLLHIDMNNAVTETLALERLYPLVLPGGAIVLDDYGWREFPKQKAAADKFFKHHSIEVLELPSGQGLAIKPSSPL